MIEVQGIDPNYRQSWLSNRRARAAFEVRQLSYALMRRTLPWKWLFVMGCWIDGIPSGFRR